MQPTLPTNLDLMPGVQSLDRMHLLALFWQQVRWLIISWVNHHQTVSRLEIIILVLSSSSGVRSGRVPVIKCVHCCVCELERVILYGPNSRLRQEMRSFIHAPQSRVLLCARGTPRHRPWISFVILCVCKFVVCEWGSFRGRNWVMMWFTTPPLGCRRQQYDEWNELEFVGANVVGP